MKGIPRRRGRLAGVVCATAVALSCARPTPVTAPAAWPPAFSLELAGQYLFPPGRVLPGPGQLLLGGISGLAWDPRARELLGISDAHDPSRIVRFRISGQGASFAVRPTGQIVLEGTPAEAGTLDPEAIAIAPGGTVLVTTEGDGAAVPRVPPGIFEYRRDGRFLRALPVPDAFVPTPTGPLVRGVRRNEAFESLTVSPDGHRLFTGSETPPVQDGAAPTTDRGAATRLLEYVAREDGTWAPGREFFYPLEPIGAPVVRPGDGSINGLVELLALGPEDLLALERSFVPGGRAGRGVNRIRLYRVSLRGAIDVASGGAGGGPLRKELVLDLAEVRGLRPELAGLDNFEGMAAGPPLADGTPSLVLVSDDNFNRGQRTAFLLFRIVAARGAVAGPGTAGAGRPHPAAERRGLS